MINNNLIQNLRELNHNINKLDNEINYLTASVHSIKKSDKYIKGHRILKESPEEFINNHLSLVGTILGVISISILILMICIIIVDNRSWWNLLWILPLSWLVSIIKEVIYNVFCRFNSSVRFYKKSLIDICQLEEEIKNSKIEVQQKNNEFGFFVEKNVIPMVHQVGLISLSEINHNFLQNLVNFEFLDSILKKEADKGKLQKIKMNNNEVMYKSLINEPKIKKYYIDYD